MNEVVLIGRLTRDPEIRYTQSQMAICHFTLAVDRIYRLRSAYFRHIYRYRYYQRCRRIANNNEEVSYKGR